MSKKQYALAIENAGGDTCIVMSKGHHDPHVFMKAVREAGYDWSLGMPTLEWVKQTPARDGIHSHWYNLVPEGTRGAFPATYAHEAYGDDRYEAQVKSVSSWPFTVAENERLQWEAWVNRG